MGLLDKVPGLSKWSEKVSASLPTSSSTSFHSVAGIEGKGDGTVHSGPDSSAGGGGAGTRFVQARASSWSDEDASSMFSISVRALQTFLPFINLCIYIALAAFQARWNVGVSFLVGLGLFFNVEALLHGGLLLATALAADKLKFLRSLDRVTRQIRVAVIINSFQALCMILMAIVTTVSANRGGCRDASTDPHADVEGYVDALDAAGFCRNKRAAAAFFWLVALAWTGALAATVTTLVRVRRHPTSTAFVVPSSGPGAGEEEGDAFNVAPCAAYRPSHDYVDEAPFGGTYSTYHANETGDVTARDPFKDPPPPPPSSRAYDPVDPYEAIKKVNVLSLDRDDAPELTFS
ncbi:hypothetical protein JCM11491_004769 [Sporobolomyces phaffii]